MKKEDVKRILLDHEEEFFFTGGVSAELIMEIENELNVKLPESYKWFLSHYGYVA